MQVVTMTSQVILFLTPPYPLWLLNATDRLMKALHISAIQRQFAEGTYLQSSWVDDVSLPLWGW
jgi:hypothetical protein